MYNLIHVFVLDKSVEELFLKEVIEELVICPHTESRWKVKNECFDQ